MKGIVLAGGAGSRLYPLTCAVSKQLLPVYDKPMIYYPLSTLMMAGVRDILVITAPRDEAAFRSLLGDGSLWGVSIDYAVQPAPEGIAQALLIGASFADGGPVALILGDNLLYGPGLARSMRQAAQTVHGATIFGYRVRDPSQYGVLVFDGDRVVDIIEKPPEPPSHWAVPGVYFYGPEGVAMASELTPSGRGELEITDLNRRFLERGALRVELLDRGTAWLDMGTPENLIAASSFVATLEARQGVKIGCPEETAWRNGFIDDEDMMRLAHDVGRSAYGAYLSELVSTGRP
jgi:glucose-1-phosphate thymidylyltransferase